MCFGYVSFMQFCVSFPLARESSEKQQTRLCASLQHLWVFLSVNLDFMSVWSGGGLIAISTMAAVHVCKFTPTQDISVELGGKKREFQIPLSLVLNQNNYPKCAIRQLKKRHKITVLISSLFHLMTQFFPAIFLSLLRLATEEKSVDVEIAQDNFIHVKD